MAGVPSCWGRGSRSRDRTCAGDGSVLRAEPLPPLPPPGSCTPPPPAAEVTPRSTGQGSAGPGQHGRGEAGVILDPSLLHGELIVAFEASAEHPVISHRPQRSVPEEFSAPLELSQPLSDLLDGRIPHPSLPCLPSEEACPRGGHPGPASGSSYLKQHLSGATSADSKPESPSTHSLLSLFRLWDPTQAPKATRASTPPLPGPAAQAGWTRHG